MPANRRHSGDRPAPWPPRVAFARLALAVLLSVFAAFAFAQSRQISVDFSIPAQPLDQALFEFSRQSGRSFFAIGDLALAGRSRAVRGRMTPEDALRRMLEGTGFTYAIRADGSVAITRGTLPGARPAITPGPPSVDPEPKRLEQVVVTGIAPGQTVATNGVSVAGLGGIEIERLGLKDAAGVFRILPGVAVVDTGAAFTQLQIRGVSGSLGGNENGYYLDDAPFTGVGVPWIPDTRAYDLERIEALKGPQGTRFGEGSMGGTVRIITNAPDLDRLAVRADTGWDSTEGGGTGGSLKMMANLPLVASQAALRVVATRETLPGWIDTAGGSRDVNAQHIDTERARLRWQQGNAWTEWLHSGYNLRAESGGYGSDDGARTTATAGVHQHWRSGTWNAGYDVDASSWLLSVSNQSLSKEQIVAIAPGVGTDSTTGIDVRNRELRWSSTAAGPLQWVVGSARREAVRNDRIVPMEGTASSVAVEQRQDNRANAHYGEVTWSPGTTAWAFTGGIRYFRERVQTAARASSGEATGLDETYARWLPRLAISRRTARDGMLYGSLSNGFRSGQSQAITAVLAGRALGEDVPLAIAPDRLRVIELGTRQWLLEQRLQFDAAVFHGRWHDVPVRDVLAPGVVGKANAGSARISGAEVGLRYHPRPGLNWQLGATYIDAVLEDEVGPTVGESPVYNVPPLTITAAIDWARPVSGTLSALFSANAAYAARRETPLVGAGAGDATCLATLGIGLESTQGWGVQLSVENLLDDDGAVDGRNAVDLATRYRPRTLRLEFRYAY